MMTSVPCIRLTGKLASLLVTSALLLATGGCAGKKGPTGPVFFPQAPNPPRVQYLMKIGSSKDVEEQKGGLSFFSFGNLDEDTVKPIKKPYGVTVHKGKIYVSDVGGSTVSIIDPPRKSFEFLKGNFSVGKLMKPVNTALDSDGNIYVADVDRKAILVYDPAGNFRQVIGKEEEMKPADVLVDGNLVFVVDIGKSEIKVFDRKSGKLVNQIGKGADLNDSLAMPTNFTLDSKGFLYVTNTMTGKVMKYDRDGHLLQSFGKLGDGFGQFGRPKGVAVDEQGRIYVADAAHQNVQIFNDSGRLLMFFGDPDTAPAGTMNLPASVAVSRDNLDYYQKLADPTFELEGVIFVTNQFGDNKVAVYGLGHLKGSRDDNAGKGGDGERKTEKPAGNGDGVPRK